MHELSFWETDTFFADADLLIVGSGIVGVNAAIAAKEREPKAEVVVVERGALPTGASTRNAGFACFGSMTELLDDLNGGNHPDEVWQLVRRRYDGLKRLRKRVGDETMQYEQLGGYEVFTGDGDTFEACLEHLEGFNAAMKRITGLPDVYSVADRRIPTFGLGASHLLFNRAEGQLHAGRMMFALIHKAQTLGVRFLTNTEITGFTEQWGNVVLGTSHGYELRARQVLFCTNGFTPRLLPRLAVQPARNQVLITEPLPNLALKGTFHYDRGYYYFRNVGNRILLGGGRNLEPAIEATDAMQANETIRAALLELLRTVVAPNIPNIDLKIDRYWTGILGIATTTEKGNSKPEALKRPIIERISPRLTVAVRMGGMGVAIGTLVGEEGAALAVGKAER